MKSGDWREVAALIHDSTNAWYESKLGFSIFPNGLESTLLFCEVYEALDPNGCLIARSIADGKIIGSCFYHPRETHFSLGIMNVHPLAFGNGVARAILQQIIQMATSERKPIRLVSSAMNLDSYSLYTKAGFVPRQTYQDMILEIPRNGIEPIEEHSSQLRDATLEDVANIASLEKRVAGIQRQKDYRHFIENERGYWHMSVLENNGQLKGWIASIAHPASNMIGPCVAVDQASAIALLNAEINFRRGETMVFLVPVECDEIVKTAYLWGAKNCEMHVSQIYGEFQEFQGVSMPTFMPETA